MSGWMMKSARGEERPFTRTQQGWLPLLEPWHRSSSEVPLPPGFVLAESFAQVYQPRNLLADYQTKQ